MYSGETHLEEEIGKRLSSFRRERLFLIYKTFRLSVIKRNDLLSPGISQNYQLAKLDPPGVPSSPGKNL